jgi:hypothetical protein
VQSAGLCVRLAETVGLTNEPSLSAVADAVPVLVPETVVKVGTVTKAAAPKVVSLSKLSIVFLHSPLKSRLLPSRVIGSAVISGSAIMLISLAARLLMWLLRPTVAEAMESVDAVRETEAFETTAEAGA